MPFKKKHHSAESMFTFLLLLVFTLFTLILAGMGATVYKNSAAHLEENYTSRTAVSYVAEKIRQHDQKDCIFLSQADHLPALTLQDTIDGEEFLTYIYFYDGFLCELFIRKDQEPNIEMGTRLVSLSEFSIEKTDSQFLTIRAVSPEGNELSITVHSRTGN